MDADWGGDNDTRRSTGGYVVFLAGGPVAWQSKVHRSVTLSSTEAELMQLAKAVQTIMWLAKMHAAMGFDTAYSGPRQIVIFEDNQGCIDLVSGTRQSKALKHVQIRTYFAREQVKAGLVSVVKVASVDNVADIFTKPLGAQLFLVHLDALLLVLGAQAHADLQL